MSTVRIATKPKASALATPRAAGAVGVAEVAGPLSGGQRLGSFYGAGPAFGLAAPVQRKCAACEAEEASEEPEPVQLWDCSEYTEPTCVQTQESTSELPVQEKCAACEAEEQVQHAGAQGRNPHRIQSAAHFGLRGASQPLPHGEKIQAAFGRHDVSEVRTQVGGAAEAANRRMGALAFTSGNRIGFRGAPSLRLAAHEAAHVVQQHAGLSLPDNVGRAGDRWERHADRVADAVVAGHSAEAVLDEVAGPGTPSSQPVESGGDVAPAAPAPVVQQQITSKASRLLEPPPVDSEVPAPAAEGSGERAEAGTGAGEQSAPADEGSVLEAAEEGDSEAPPEGITVGGAAPPAAGTPASPAGAPASGAGPSTPAGGAPAPTASTPAPAAGAPAPATGGGTPAPGTAAQEASGGGINAPCYNVDPPPPPANAQEPSGDNQGAEPKAESRVTFDEWPAEADTCQAQAAMSEAGQQMPDAVGGGSTAAEGASAAAGPPAATELETAAPTTAMGSEGAPASASREVQAMSRAATAQSDQSLAEAGGMEGQIGSAESERDTAVTDYLTSTDGLGAVIARSRSLEPGVTFPSAEGPQQAEARQAAIDAVQAFMARAADQIAAAVAFAREQVPGRLGGLAEATKANIQGAMETEKAAISDRIAQARTQARAGAAAARAHVHAEYANSAAQIEASTLAALSALDTAHETSAGQVDEKETTGLEDVNSRCATGRTQHEVKGPEYAARAIARGQEHAHAYEECKEGYHDDGTWNGCLTVRRAKAQQKAACETAAGYKEGFLRTANKKGYDLRELRKQKRCAVITGARQVHQTLDDTHERLVSGLESGRMQAMAGLALARDENLAAVDNALAATLKSLSAQEFSQRQAVNDTGYLKQLAVEQLAHSSAANLARGISAAMDSLEQTLTTLRERFARSGVPAPELLAQALAEAEAALGGGMGTLLSTMEEGASQAEARIGGLGAAALDALLLLTAKNDELSSQAESGFASQMDGLKSAASQTFGQLTENHVQQAQQAMTEGTASMRQAVTGFDQALATIGGEVDAAIARSLQELQRELDQQLGGLDGRIASEAWKAAEKEQPAWKSVVAIVLIIVVIIAAAVISFVTLGATAGPFAMILVGALVGAVSGGLIQLINNWASGEAWHTGLVQAMVMGAIGGAIGGGLGFAGGALAKGAAAAGAGRLVQFAFSAGADLLSEGITQTIGYVAFGQEFSWQGFVMAGAMSAVSFRAHPSGPHGGMPDVPTPSTAGAGGARRAAVAQIAGGAALGLGLEYAAAKLSGRELDLSAAASAAASAAVTTRMARRGAPAGPAPEPTTRLGHALERFRTFDPGGIGARLETGLEGLGGRAFGARSDVEVPGGGRPRGGEAGGGPASEPEAARARTEESTPMRPSEEAPDRRRSSEGPEATREVPDTELAQSTRRPTRVGDEDHEVFFRERNGRIECDICSFACGDIKVRLRRIRDSIPDTPENARILQELDALHQRVTQVEIGIENATMPHRDAINASGDIADRLQRLGSQRDSFGRELNPTDVFEPPRPGAGERPRVRTDDLGVSTEVVGSVRVGNHDLPDIPDGTPLLYVLRDPNTGAILKVGQTFAGESADTRFGRYARAASELGLNLQLEVTRITDPRVRQTADINPYESALRARMQAAGHIMPWDYTVVPGGGGRGRLGREGPGTPFEQPPGGSRLRSEGWDWEWGDVPAKGYLLPPGRGTGTPRPPRGIIDIDELASMLQENPRPSQREIAARFGVNQGNVSRAISRWRQQLRDRGVEQP